MLGTNSEDLCWWAVSLRGGAGDNQRGAIVGKPPFTGDLGPIAPLDGSKENPMHPIGSKSRLVLNRAIEVVWRASGVPEHECEEL